MKRLFYIIILFLALVKSYSASVTLAWDQTTETNVSTYRIYSSSVLGTNIFSVQYPTTSYTITNVVAGTNYTFWATAVNNFGLESSPSTSIGYVAPIGIPPENKILSPILGGYQGGFWQNISFSWAAVDKNLYQFTYYYVNVENTDTATKQVYSTTLTNYNIASLAVANYKIYVTSTNVYGSSPVTTWLTLSSKKPNSLTNFRLVTVAP